MKEQRRRIYNQCSIVAREDAKTGDIELPDEYKAELVPEQDEETEDGTDEE